ncbi:MAG: RNA polymerase sigma factor [Candidatus Kerfeldbacteria bacterium]|nr:RNA polymerase sigma factor [Candidatus Kerfeldbacteria bacterium]
MDLSELPDEELAARTQDGEVRAFAEIINRYQKRLLRYGRRFLRNTEDVEDAVQDALLNAYRNIAGFRTGERLSPWLYRIAHNTFVSLIRSRKREPLPFFDPDSLFPHPVAPDQSDSVADVAMIRRQLDRGLAALDAKYREILVLRYDHNLSYAEISDVLRLPLGTVSIRIKRALAKLQSQFNDHDRA